MITLHSKPRNATEVSENVQTLIGVHNLHKTTPSGKRVPRVKLEVEKLGWKSTEDVMRILAKQPAILDT